MRYEFNPMRLARQPRSRAIRQLICRCHSLGAETGHTLSASAGVTEADFFTQVASPDIAPIHATWWLTVAFTSLSACGVTLGIATNEPTALLAITEVVERPAWYRVRQTSRCSPHVTCSKSA